MDDQSALAPAAQNTPLAPWWLRVLGALAEPWLRIKREPADPRATCNPAVPVCYVIERYGLSDTLILEQACREAGLPEPLRPFDIAGVAKRRAVFALSRRDGWWFQRPRSRTHSETLAQLLDASRAHADLDVQLVPVSIFVGRAPDRESGWFRVLFAENWGRGRSLPAPARDSAQRARHDRAIRGADLAAQRAGERTRCAEHAAQGLARAARAFPPPARDGHRSRSFASAHADRRRPQCRAGAERDRREREQGEPEQGSGDGQGARFRLGNRRRPVAPVRALGVVSAHRSVGQDLRRRADASFRQAARDRARPRNHLRALSSQPYRLSADVVSAVSQRHGGAAYRRGHRISTCRCSARSCAVAARSSCAAASRATRCIRPCSANT